MWHYRRICSAIVTFELATTMYKNILESRGQGKEGDIPACTDNISNIYLLLFKCESEKHKTTPNVSPLEWPILTLLSQPFGLTEWCGNWISIPALKSDRLLPNVNLLSPPVHHRRTQYDEETPTNLVAVLLPEHSCSLSVAHCTPWLGPVGVIVIQMPPANRCCSRLPKSSSKHRSFRPPRQRRSEDLPQQAGALLTFDLANYPSRVPKKILPVSNFP